MPELEVEQDKEEQQPPKPVVGIIYPPPEVRNIVDKTADFVARNGPEFAERIRQNEAGNPKFNFLTPTDPYHAYYLHKINEIQEGRDILDTPTQQAKSAKPSSIQPLMAEPEVPKEAPPEWEYLVDPPSISGIELDIVKLTAMFVAKNGTSFLDKLMMREQKNYQFDFLRKQHTLFSYFTKLVEQYSKILLPSKDIKQKLRRDCEDPQSVLQRVKHRSDWDRHQAHVRRKEQEEAEKDRMEYASIDWHDFVVAETIAFREDESGFLPPPIKPSQLAARLIEQAKYEKMQEETEVEEIEMEVEDMGEPSQPEPQPPTTPSVVMADDGSTLIRKDYNPKAKQKTPAAAEQFMVSPITGEKVSAEEMQKHMRYNLLDPRWIELQQKKVEEKKQQDEVYAQGLQIGTTLKHLAERRTDIFGIGGEETVIGRKIGEEEKGLEPQQWDGFRASASMLSARALASITSEDEAIYTKKQEEHNKSHIGPADVVTLKLPVSQTLQPLLSSAPPVSDPPKLTPLQPPRALLATPPTPPDIPPMQIRPGPLIPPPNQQPLPLFPPSAPLIRGTGPPSGPPQLMATNLGPRPPPLGEEPSAKRSKTDSDNFIPEMAFISKNPGPVTFKVQVPSVPDKPELNLTGQIISVTLPITDPVSVLKARITDEIGIPASKQKLQIGSVFIKDSNSLGYYNIIGSTMVTLGLKERGGRKK